MLSSRANECQRKQANTTGVDSGSDVTVFADNKDVTSKDFQLEHFMRSDIQMSDLPLAVN